MCMNEKVFACERESERERERERDRESENGNLHRVKREKAPCLNHNSISRGL